MRNTAEVGFGGVVRCNGAVIRLMEQTGDFVHLKVVLLLDGAQQVEIEASLHRVERGDG